MNDQPDNNSGNPVGRGFTPPNPNDPQPNPQVFHLQPTQTFQNPAQNNIPQAPSPTPQPISNPFTTQVPPVNDPNSKFFSPSGSINQPKKSRKKLFIISGATLAFFLLLGAGYVFGYYIPNKPENVWRTGLNRTGEALEKLTNQALTDESIAKIDSTELAGTLEVKSPDVNFNGSMQLVYDPKKTKGDIKISSNVNGDEQQSLGLDFLAEATGDNKYPDIFFKFIGIKEYTDAFGLSEISKYEGKWISIDNKYIQENLPEEETDNNTVTSQDISEVARIGVETSNEYIFTNDPQKAILVQKFIVGPEVVDGLSTYRYKVSLNKDNVQKYCEAMVDRAYESDSARKVFYLNDDNLDVQKADAKKECESTKDSVNEDEEFDMWVDRKYKLIHKVRVAEKDDENTYVEFGQIYKGGDEIVLFTRFKDNENQSTANLNITANFKSYETKGEFIYSGSLVDNELDVKFTFDVKPYDQDIQIDRPKNAIPIDKILRELGLDQSINSEPSAEENARNNTSSDGIFGIQTKAKDSERQTDINAIHGQLEAYYAQFGVYPSSNDINNPTWQSQNLPGLDKEAFKDPDGVAYMLADGPAMSAIYGYEVTPIGCVSDGTSTNPCTAYSLTSQLSSGELFKKLSLN